MSIRSVLFRVYVRVYVFGMLLWIISLVGLLFFKDVLPAFDACLVVSLLLPVLHFICGLYFRRELKEYRCGDRS